MEGENGRRETKCVALNDCKVYNEMAKRILTSSTLECGRGFEQVGKLTEKTIYFFLA